MKTNAIVLAIALCLRPGAAAAQTADARELTWAGDAEGGAPFVEADPARLDQVVGFDVDIASLIARGLGRAPRFVMISFASIDQSITRGDADIGLSGIEDTAARRSALAVTLPYYEFREVLAVRDADAGRLRTLTDLRGRNVATLAGTIAYEILLGAERDHGLHAVSYEDDVHPYSDLLLGRVDAVLLIMLASAAADDARHYHPAVDGRDRPLRRRPRRRERAAQERGQRCLTNRDDGRPRSSASSAPGRCGTRISRS